MLEQAVIHLQEILDDLIDEVEASQTTEGVAFLRMAESHLGTAIYHLKKALVVETDYAEEVFVE